MPARTRPSPRRSRRSPGSRHGERRPCGDRAFSIRERSTPPTISRAHSVRARGTLANQALHASWRAPPSRRGRDRAPMQPLFGSTGGSTTARCLRTGSGTARCASGPVTSSSSTAEAGAHPAVRIGAPARRRTSETKLRDARLIRAPGRRDCPRACPRSLPAGTDRASPARRRGSLSHAASHDPAVCSDSFLSSASAPLRCEPPAGWVFRPHPPSASTSERRE